MAKRYGDTTPMREEAVTSLRALNEVVERLRGPGGCPWDREQTHETLRQYLLEETYETLEAIESGHPATLREELGDVLLQVLMHSAIAQENADGGFDIGDVADTTRIKMVNRHPHVFGNTSVSTSQDVLVNWEKIKAQEKGERTSVIEGVPLTLPALAFALGIQKRPARVGFDLTPDLGSALDWSRSGIDEVARLAATFNQRAPEGLDLEVGAETPPPPSDGHPAPPAPAPAELEAAVGDLLFAVVAVARRLRINPEDALRRRSTAFGVRFRTVEAELRAEGADLHATAPETWTDRWHAAPAPTIAPNSD